MIRLWLGNTLRDVGRQLARADGGQLAVVLSEHRIKDSMERPDTSVRAWDPTMYVSGNLFIEGYANPIKPVAHRIDDMEEMDRATLEESAGLGLLFGDDAPEVAADGGEAQTESEDPHLELQTSWRYKEYQDQHLITELVRPEEQWKMIIYVLIAIAAVATIGLLLDVFMVFA